MKFVRTEETSHHPATILNIDCITSVYVGEFTTEGKVNARPTLWARLTEGNTVTEHPLRICATLEEAEEYLERFAKIAGNALDISAHSRNQGAAAE